ncbi:hypothetical protein BOTCAL_0033g00430 [Botryotinia calthae]|uniref:Uncharacterized protein n=1 Tax=Botryotinia calthae TaxID=38488 RepID=A0A4Y8DDA5_9HELO|nr:hypothetical protein BOTCAL_0033g00430 [Botryotinia calthae]
MVRIKKIGVSLYFPQAVIRRRQAVFFVGLTGRGVEIGESNPIESRVRKLHAFVLDCIYFKWKFTLVLSTVSAHTCVGLEVNEVVTAHDP